MDQLHIEKRVEKVCVSSKLPYNYHFVGFTKLGLNIVLYYFAMRVEMNTSIKNYNET